MALWKPFRGSRADLDSVPKHDGYVYWCVDDSSLHFDYADSEGVLHRKQVNSELESRIQALEARLNNILVAEEAEF